MHIISRHEIGKLLLGQMGEWGLSSSLQAHIPLGSPNQRVKGIADADFIVHSNMYIVVIE